MDTIITITTTITIIIRRVGGQPLNHLIAMCTTEWTLGEGDWGDFIVGGSGVEGGKGGEGEIPM